MKLALYRKNDQTCFGVVTDEGLFTLNGKLGAGINDFSDLLGQGDMAAVAALVAGGKADTTLDQVTLLPMLPAGAKILCAGLNYQSHADETGRDKPKPNVGFFIRVASSLVAHGQNIVLPRVSPNFDFEGELCVVIGKGGRHIPVAEAMRHVAGYTCLMDGSVRDYQKNSVSAGKNFDASGAVGPFMVTADEIADVEKLELTTRLNGDVVQRSGVDRLIHSIPRMIAYMSGIMKLSPGDLLATGTPDGVGWHRTPQLWLKHGDRLEIDIPGVGMLCNTVAAEGQAA